MALMRIWQMTKENNIINNLRLLKNGIFLIMAMKL